MEPKRLLISVDCIWSSYQVWSKCSKLCGGGKKLSQRVVIQEPLNGGKECEGSRTKVERCNEKPCEGMIRMITV